MAKIYYENDANLELIRGKTIGIIGFGSQGHAHALNLRDSGMNVMVGLYPGSKSWQQAQVAGLRVGPVEEVARSADIIMMLAPDQVQKKIYDESIAPSLRAGQRFIDGSAPLGRICPSAITAPTDGRSNPPRSRARVDLPEPLAPVTASASDDRSSRSTSASSKPSVVSTRACSRDCATSVSSSESREISRQ